MKAEAGGFSQLVNVAPGAWVSSLPDGAACVAAAVYSSARVLQVWAAVVVEVAVMSKGAWWHVASSCKHAVTSRHGAEPCTLAPAAMEQVLMACTDVERAGGR